MKKADMSPREFAAAELNKYFFLVTGEKNCGIRLLTDKTVLPAGAAVSAFDDGFIIDVASGEGTIRGVNERSLLLGVYKMFTETGARFFRPGPQGEKLVKVPKEKFNVKLIFKPSYRHRGIAIEGAVSVKNAADMIDWLPKAGFNSYFIQFRNGYVFFDRWYSHQRNGALAPEKFGPENMGRVMKKLTGEIKKRGLIYHAVGHGWTRECFGSGANGWYKDTGDIPENIKGKLALVKGERKYFCDYPMNTHLCYSQPEVRGLLAAEVENYLIKHPEIDALHFWLADGCNNVCECENCQKNALSDFYVRILNEIDARLTARKINTKIVFLIYVELLWPPRAEKIKNPDRFIMMFAPISRTYTKSFAGDASEDNGGALMKYERNDVQFPSDNRTYINFLRAWRRVFPGDGFDFDYHLWCDIYRDLSGESLARVLYEDISALRDIGLNGFLSCQLQRAFWPSGLPMYLMAAALNDRDMKFEKIKDDYYAAAFGPYAQAARALYAEIDAQSIFAYLRNEIPLNDKDSIEKMKRLAESLPAHISALRNIRRKGGGAPSDNASVKNLVIFAEYLKMLLPVLIMKAEGAQKEIFMAAYAPVKDFFDRNEMNLQAVADGCYLSQVIGDLAVEYRV